MNEKSEFLKHNEYVRQKAKQRPKKSGICDKCGSRLWKFNLCPNCDKKYHDREKQEYAWQKETKRAGFYD